MAREPPPIVKLNRKPAGGKDRPGQTDRANAEQRGRERHSSGEGSESALDSLRKIERDRERSRPSDDIV